MTDPVRATTVNGHRAYSFEGRHGGQPVFPSVTWICRALSAGDVLVAWAAKMTAERAWANREWLDWPQDRAEAFLKGAWRDARDSGGARGTGVHEYIEARLGGAPAASSPTGYQQAVERFLDEVRPRPELVEMTVASDRPGVLWAGTTDFVGVLPAISGARCLVDWKTTGEIWPEAQMQLLAYATGPDFCIDAQGQEHAWRPMTDVYGVLFRDTGSYAIRQVPHDQRTLIAFRACLELRKWEDAKLKTELVKPEPFFDELALEQWLQQATPERRQRLADLCLEAQKGGMVFNTRKAERTAQDRKVMLNLITIMEMEERERAQ
jgi:hypothetical protein